MTKIPISRKKSIQLSFEGDCLQTLQRFAHPSKSGGEEQIRLDLQRISALTIGKWHYEMPSERGSAELFPPYYPS